MAKNTSILFFTEGKQPALALIMPPAALPEATAATDRLRLALDLSIQTTYKQPT
jgi:hypothetical protein